MNKFLRICRTVHSWTGVLLLPWILVIGATGFYLNHNKTFDDLIGQEAFDEAQLEAYSPPEKITPEVAVRLANTVWPDRPVEEVGKGTFRDWPVFVVKKKIGTVMLSVDTGHFYVKDRVYRRTFSPRGELLRTEVEWKRIFRGLHERGWLGNAMGTWFADIVALAMVFFGLSGLIMWTVPKVRRLRRRFSPAPLVAGTTPAD